MRFQYADYNPAPESLALIEWADATATALADQGYTLTLRQLFYQGVQSLVFPNTEHAYDRLGALVERGRMAGLIDWDHIVDRTRRFESVPHWDDPQAILRDDAKQFRIDKWIDQPFYVEAWVEKEALIDVIAQPARREDIGWFACRGYASASSQHEAAERFIAAIQDEDRQPVILHLGDHDPSGVDMSRDIFARINTFVQARTSGNVEVRRLALNMEQVRQYNPPPNPAKTKDSRFAAYAKRFGESSWELDALDPPTIDALITAAVEDLRPNVSNYMDRIEEEAEHRSLLKEASERWDAVKDFLNG